MWENTRQFSGSFWNSCGLLLSIRDVSVSVWTLYQFFFILVYPSGSCSSPSLPWQWSLKSRIKNVLLLDEGKPAAAVVQVTSLAVQCFSCDKIFLKRGPIRSCIQDMVPITFWNKSNFGSNRDSCQFFNLRCGRIRGSFPAPFETWLPHSRGSLLSIRDVSMKRTLYLFLILVFPSGSCSSPSLPWQRSPKSRIKTILL